MTATIDGYIGGEVYPTGFHRHFTPQWIDAALRHRGLRPPRSGARASFALLDLGCGDGLALVGLAAAHPEGRFVGVDALAEHIERGRASAAYAGVENVAFHHARFAEMDDAAEPAFDYVTAQGVLAWVSPDNREHLRRLCATYLKPGGVACIGYNTLPGWTRALAVQQMLCLLAEDQAGDAVQRWQASLDQLRRIVGAGVPGPAAEFLDWLDGLAGAMPARYFPHEYLNRHWQPLWAGQEHAAMARRGLRYAGPSRAEVIRPDFLLHPDQLDALAEIDSGPAQETAFDLMLDQSFRVDLFGRHVAVAPDARADRLDGWWAATRPAARVQYELVTPERTIRCDTPAGRALVSALKARPQRLSAIATGATFDQDLLDAVDLLWITGQVVPCDPPADPAAATRFNYLNAAAAKTGAPLPALVGRHGIMPVDHDTIVAADEGDAEAVGAMLRLGLITLA